MWSYLRSFMDLSVWRRMYSVYNAFPVDDEALDFFNALVGELEVNLTDPPQPIGGLLNLAASPDATIISLRLRLKVVDGETQEHRPLTSAELNKAIFRGRSIQLSGQSGKSCTHRAPDGRSFKVSDLIAAIEATEYSTRGATEWFGDIDVHHVYFEGIHFNRDGVWEIYWGS